MTMPRLTRRAAIAGGLAAVPALTGLGATAARPRSTVKRFYRADDGANLQPAFQRAIDWAGQNDSDLVSDFGRIAGELWCPERIGPTGPDGNGIPLVVRHGTSIDFGGATFRLRGPGGNRVRAQRGSGDAQPWLGGWLYASAAGGGIDRLEIANVAVDGMFVGDFVTNRESNLTDKGFMLFDERVREVVMRNVELRNFGGEIYYVGGPGPVRQLLENCHFHGSPQCAWNPGGTGKLVAINLRAGRAYQCAEVIGGKGHVYRGGHFYAPGNGGSSFFGGPSPGFRSGYPYSYAWWDGQGAPPYIRFEGTEFSGGHALWLGSWIEGRVRLVDTSIYFNPGVGHLRDIDLDIDAVCDAGSGNAVVTFGGVPQPGARMAKAPADALLLPPSDIHLRIACSRTARARAAARTWATGFRFNGGHYDRDSLDVLVKGEVNSAVQMFGDGARGFPQPRVRDGGIVPR